MDGKHAFCGFNFYDEALIHQDIKTQVFFKDVAFVLDRDSELLDCGDLLEGELTHQTFFVNALKQAGTLFTVYLDCSTDDFARPRMSFFVKWIHRSSTLRSFAIFVFQCLFLLRDHVSG